MRQVPRRDMMEQIIAMLAEERAKEKELLARRERETRPSTGAENPGINIMPAQGPND
jgi:hypothetical protein